MKNAHSSSSPVISTVIRASFDDLKKIARWGTFGPSGNDPLKWVKLIDCSTEHLEAILKTQHHIIGTAYVDIIKSILADRR